ncbi:MAG: M67 family metallopeptidase [Thermomicrobiales bacterium]|nr:M67 family metallopeptidase [Thermomicrobiales bacterium]
MMELAISRVDQFIVPAVLRDEVLVHLARCMPNEGVGLLGAFAPEETGKGITARAALYVPGTNLEQSPTHYTMDPLEVMRAFRRFTEEGLLLGAIVHSHIASPATPSPSDLREWNYPEAIMMIASFATQPPVLNAYRISQVSGLPVPQSVEIQIIQADTFTSGER